jgi:hypothetical protein
MEFALKNVLIFILPTKIYNVNVKYIYIHISLKDKYFFILNFNNFGIFLKKYRYYLLIKKKFIFN